MWAEIVKLVSVNAGISVFLALLLIALILGSISIFWSIWVVPKLAAIDKLKEDFAKVDGSLATMRPAERLDELSTLLASANASLKALSDANSADKIAGISGRVSALESAREAERELDKTHLKSNQETVIRLSEEIRQLQARSGEEIIRMLTQNKIEMAIEQAGQDVDLAEIGEQLARLQPALHKSATERLASAKERLQQLKARQNTAS